MKLPLLSRTVQLLLWRHGSSSLLNVKRLNASILRNSASIAQLSSYVAGKRLRMRCHVSPYGGAIHLPEDWTTKCQRASLYKMLPEMKVPRIRPLVLLIVLVLRWRWLWSIGGIILAWETEVLWQQPVPLPLCRPQIWTEATAGRGRQLKTDFQLRYIHTYAYTHRTENRMCNLWQDHPVNAG